MLICDVIWQTDLLSEILQAIITFEFLWYSIAYSALYCLYCLNCTSSFDRNFSIMNILFRFNIIVSVYIPTSKDGAYTTIFHNCDIKILLSNRLPKYLQVQSHLCLFQGILE